MRIIHTADVHLDSALRSNFDAAKAKERNLEVLNTFLRLVDYAVDSGINHILIAGDLFDSCKISSLTQKAVERAVINNAGINFYYLKGNHDNTNFFDDVYDLPANLHLFTDDFTCFNLSDRVKLWGCGRVPDSDAVNNLNLVDEDVNIIMLHGQTVEHKSGSEDEINIADFRHRGINYLALGHVHDHRIERLDSDNSFYCYPGCLEGRGFDETGEHGFVVLDINEATGVVTPSFVPFASRRIFDISVDVSGINDMYDIILKCHERIKLLPVTDKDILKINVIGEVSLDFNVDTEYIRISLASDFYFVKVKNLTKIRISYEDYLSDETLKGEFVRLVMASDLSEQEKGAVIKCGIEALAGGLS